MEQVYATRPTKGPLSLVDAASKPHYGRIDTWHRVWLNPDRYAIFGFSMDHHRLAGHLMTSFVIDHDPGTGEIETFDARYRLVGDELAK